MFAGQVASRDRPMAGPGRHRIRARRGVVTGVRKVRRPGKVVATFCLGTRQLYDFKHGTRNGDWAALMSASAKRNSEEPTRLKATYWMPARVLDGQAVLDVAIIGGGRGGGSGFACDGA